MPLWILDSLSILCSLCVLFAACCLASSHAWFILELWKWNWYCVYLTILFQIEDARAAMMLYQKNRKEWEKKLKDQIRLKQKQKKRKHKKKSKGTVIESWQHWRTFFLHFHSFEENHVRSEQDGFGKWFLLYNYLFYSHK